MEEFIFKKEYYAALKHLSLRQRSIVLDLLFCEIFNDCKVDLTTLSKPVLSVYYLLRSCIGVCVNVSPEVSGDMLPEVSGDMLPEVSGDMLPEAVKSERNNNTSGYNNVKFMTNDSEFEEFCKCYDYFPHLEQSKRGAFTIWNAKCLMLSEKREIIAAASLYNETRGAKMYMVAPAKFLRTNEYKNASNWIKPGKSNRDPKIITADKLMEATINNNKIYKELLRNGQ